MGVGGLVSAIACVQGVQCTYRTFYNPAQITILKAKDKKVSTSQTFVFHNVFNSCGRDHL